MSKKIESPRIKLDMTQQAATQVNRRLSRVLAMEGDGEVTCFEGGSQFPDAPVCDSK